MLPRLGGSNCSVFSAFPVERGCWWLPMMYIGRECLGVPAMRTAEFLALLDDTVKSIRSYGLPASIGLHENAFAAVAARMAG
jgi:hypothetical protein